MRATRTSRRISRRPSRKSSSRRAGKRAMKHAVKPLAKAAVKPATRPGVRSTVRPAATAAGRPVARPVGRIGSKLQPAPQVLVKLCRSGWAVIVEKIPNAQGTRFVCPFCPLSHRVPGPVRGFKRLRRAQWVKLRRVEE